MKTHYTIETIGEKKLESHLNQLTELLHVAVLDGASVSFVLPFSLANARAFWVDKIHPALVQSNRILLVAKAADQVAGCVMLDFDMPPNQPHRAEIAKLLVHPKFRRNGIARALMQQVEKAAIEKQLKLLVLDTASDGAQRLYSGLGYTIAGKIPKFALDTATKNLEATTIMYKQISG